MAPKWYSYILISMKGLAGKRHAGLWPGHQGEGRRLLPVLEKMALVRQEEGRFRGDRGPGYLREWLQALTAHLPFPLWGPLCPVFTETQRKATKRLGFSGIAKCTCQGSESVLSPIGMGELTNPLSHRNYCCCPSRRTRWAKGQLGEWARPRASSPSAHREGVAVT